MQQQQVSLQQDLHANNAQFQSTMSNEGTINGDFTATHKFTKKQDDTGLDNKGMTKRAKEFVIVNTASLGGALTHFGEKLPRLSELQQDHF